MHHLFKLKKVRKRKLLKIVIYYWSYVFVSFNILNIETFIIISGEHHGSCVLKKYNNST